MQILAPFKQFNGINLQLFEKFIKNELVHAAILEIVNCIDNVFSTRSSQFASPIIKFFSKAGHRRGSLKLILKMF